MAGTNSAEHPIPMLDTAEAIIDSDDGIETFIYSLFPNATPDQITMIKLFAVSWFMEGEEMGRVLVEHGATDDLSGYEEQLTAADLDSLKIEEHTIPMKGFCLYHRKSDK